MIKENFTPSAATRASALKIVLAAFAGAFGILMFLIAPSADKPVGHYLFGGFCLLIVGVCFTSGRAQRVLGSTMAAALLAVTTWYLISEVRGDPRASPPRSEPSIVNAILAVLAFGVPSGLYLLRARFGFGPEPDAGRALASVSLDVNDEGIRVESEGKTHHVSWVELRSVRIVTTSAGPWSEDVFFVLEGDGESRCVVPHEIAVKHQLLEKLQARLEGWRDDKVIEAMGSTNDATFTIWERSIG